MKRIWLGGCSGRAGAPPGGPAAGVGGPDGAGIVGGGPEDIISHVLTIPMIYKSPNKRKHSTEIAARSSKSTKVQWRKMMKEY